MTKRNIYDYRKCDIINSTLVFKLFKIQTVTKTGIFSLPSVMAFHLSGSACRSSNRRFPFLSEGNLIGDMLNGDPIFS